PFTGKSKTAVIAAQIYETPSTLHAMAEPGVKIDPRVEAIYARALAKEPSERFADAGALAAAIAAVPARGPMQISGCYAALPREQPKPLREAVVSWWRRSRRLVAAVVFGVLVATLATQVLRCHRGESPKSAVIASVSESDEG
ncbi:MAG: hypothetical protein KC431_21550, partial [Myxococcales bacterium]|nr:hypothetical protein [Myxococcales bacterium]